MKKQRIFASFLALAMLFGVAGCGKAGTSSDSSDDPAGVLIEGFEDETVSGGGNTASGGRLIVEQDDPEPGKTPMECTKQSADFILSNTAFR